MWSWTQDLDTPGHSIASPRIAGELKPSRGEERFSAPKNSAENAVLGEASHIGWVFCIPSWHKKDGFQPSGWTDFFDFPEDLTAPGSWDPRSEMPP